MDRTISARTGMWFAYIALALLSLGWLMQAYSLINWERAVDFGLQNERFSDDTAEKAWALESRGVAIADMIWPLPLTVLAFVGIHRRRLYGFTTGLMVFSTGVYFPLVFTFQRWPTHPGTAIIALLLWFIPSLCGIAGLWINHAMFISVSR